MIYLRFETKSGKIKTALVTSKSRVSPIKSQTIPRLELLGALLLCRLLHQVSLSLSSVYKINDMFAWIDSSIAYSWIVNTKKHFKPFIQNRVKEIRENIPVASWKLIQSAENPSDIISRGATPLTIASNNMWFDGPAFLNLPENEWPDLKVGDNFLDSMIDNGKAESTDLAFHNSNNMSEPIIDGNPCLERVDNNIVSLQSDVTFLKSDTDEIYNSNSSEIIDPGKYVSFNKLIQGGH